MREREFCVGKLCPEAVYSVKNINRLIDLRGRRNALNRILLLESVAKAGDSNFVVIAKEKK